MCSAITNAGPSPEGTGFLRRSPSQERGHERVSEILSACRAILLEMPFYKITIGMIAKRAGMQPGTVYFFFPDKTAIFCSLIEAVLRDIATTQQEVAAKAVDLPGLLTELERRLAAIWEENASLLDLYFSYRSLPAVRDFESELGLEARIVVRQRIAHFLPELDEIRLDTLTILILSHISAGLDVAFKYDPVLRPVVRREWLSMLLAYVASSVAGPVDSATVFAAP